MVICGHIHQENYQTHKHIQFMSSPSMCFQFTPDIDEYRLDEKMPGYRWVNLFDDGSFDTEVIRLPMNESLMPDFSSKGYK